MQTLLCKDIPDPGRDSFKKLDNCKDTKPQNNERNKYFNR